MRLPLHIALRRSRYLTTGLMAGHFLAMAGVLTLPWPFPLQGLLLCSVGLALVAALRQPLAYAALRIETPARISARSVGAASEWRDLVVRSSVLLGPLVMVRLRETQAERDALLVLLPDSAAAEELRALRVWLRCYRPPGRAEEADCA